jgi:hypothetical protein
MRTSIKKMPVGTSAALENSLQPTFGRLSFPIYTSQNSFGKQLSQKQLMAAEFIGSH